MNCNFKAVDNETINANIMYNYNENKFRSKERNIGRERKRKRGGDFGRERVKREGKKCVVEPVEIAYAVNRGRTLSRGEDTQTQQQGSRHTKLSIFQSFSVFLKF